MRLPRSDVARAAARSVGADRHGHRGRSPRRRGAARRDGRRVRRLRRGWRVQRRADGHAAARARLRGAAPRAGPHDGGLRPERPRAAFAGAARRQPDRVRRLRHRRGRGARLHRGRRRHRGAGSPQGGGTAAGDRRHGQSEPAGLHLRPDIAVRRRGGVPDRGGDGAHAAPAGVLQCAHGAGPDRPARSGGAGDGVRRDAADRGESRAGLPGAEGDGAARASSASPRCSMWRRRATGSRPRSPAALRWARASTPPGASPRPISGCACCCARTRWRRRRWPPRSMR